jgi:ATP phosphoribosyltransferase regulatory subunit
MTDSLLSDNRWDAGERWLLPEGVDEYLPQQAERLEALRRELLNLFHSWGYELVIPPLIEYLESLLVGAGHELDLETFKLIDQSTGRLMGVRADMTPQVARIDAHRLRREAPTRLCYLDTVLLTRQDGFARSRTPLQLGAELYGHAGIESDIEMLRLMTETLRVTGLQEFYLDLGHVAIFRSLARQAQLNNEQEQVLFDALQRKAKPEIEEFLGSINIDNELRRMLVSLVELNGNYTVLDEAQSMLAKAGKDVQQALENLQRIARMARSQLSRVPIHFDLAELRGYRYQSGVVFAAFAPGHGQEIARGGRYDEIGRLFGRPRPATGFSSDLKTLMALSPPVSYAPRAIFAPASECEALQRTIKQLRQQGERIIGELPGQSGTICDQGCDRRLEKKGSEWVVVAAD